MIVRCPVCSADKATPLHHVAWGGLLAPRLYQLVRCGGCGARFSSLTGQRERDLVGRYLGQTILGALAVLVGVVVVVVVWRALT